MALVKEVHSTGADISGTLSGNISIENTPGQIIIRNGTTAQALFGAHPVDGHVGVWITKDGVDVIEELKS